MNPIGAFYLSLLHRIQEVKHPDDALAPNDPARFLSPKPRGIFDAVKLRSLDTAFSGGPSEVVQVYVKKDGTLKNHNSDAAGSEDFQAVLKHVRHRLGELTDRILAGDIGIALIG